ncbi:MAG: lipoate-protein ligase B [Rhodospirillaceae bacterium]|nr:lipoate-protein ligase B [Rhodospirillaceae bacterium]
MRRIEWKISDGLVNYEDALRVMNDRVELIYTGKASELVWLLQHPPIYTAGTSAHPQDLLDKTRFPTYKTGRGGQYTYHGPGQRVAYVMLDLRHFRQDVRQYITYLETWIIQTLSKFQIQGKRGMDRVGIWVNREDLGEPARKDKIGAIGVRIRRWITLHGVSINISSDLEHFSGIVPCGLRGEGVTSFKDLGSKVSMAEVDRELRAEFVRVFSAEGTIELEDSVS